MACSALVDKPCLFWEANYHSDMNKRDTIRTDLNALEDFNPLVPSQFQKCDCLLLGNISPSIQKNVVLQLNDRPSLIILDSMNFWIDNNYSELIEVITMVDIVCLNDEEMRILTKKKSLIDSCNWLLDLGVKNVIVKKGENGAVLVGEEGIFYSPSMPLSFTTDPTGAGDTFIGAFAGYVSKTKDYSFKNFKKAILYGSVLASFCVEGFGIEGIVDLKDFHIENRYKQFIKLISL